MQNKVRPFVKWAGGKQKLLEKIRKTYPEEIIRYCEPFVGGGAVLLDILEHHAPEEVLINDINPELINTYRKIQAQPEDIIQHLAKLEQQFLPADTETRKQIYLEKRKRFNALLPDTGKKTVWKKPCFLFF